MSPSTIQPGTKLVDSSCGPCTATDKPRYIPGGYVVDVQSPSPFPGESDLRWTACLCNLSPAPEAKP
jgi:hypothetical protein